MLPQGWGAIESHSPKNGEQELCSPKTGVQESYTLQGAEPWSPRMGPRSGGWQKSWIYEALDSVLNYGPHRKNEVQIEELSLNQAQQNKSRQWKDIVSSRSKLNRV